MKTLIACVSAREEFGLFEKNIDMLRETLRDGDESWIFDKVSNRPNLPLPVRLQEIFTDYIDVDLIVYMHDDLKIYDFIWFDKVVAHFEQHPHCAVVGFGGATALGHPDLYKTPYRLMNLARDGYASNQRDWQIHGAHLTEAKRVAVIDGFFMAIRRDLLRKAGGWPVDKLTHHCCDTWVCCEAARQGKEVWALPIDCTHFGGQTSTSAQYFIACKERGTTVAKEHEEPHGFIYCEYKDVLPMRIR